MVICLVLRYSFFTLIVRVVINRKLSIEIDNRTRHLLLSRKDWANSAKWLEMPLFACTVSYSLHSAAKLSDLKGKIKA
jgi:hypothetical protein